MRYRARIQFVALYDQRQWIGRVHDAYQIDGGTGVWFGRANDLPEMVRLCLMEIMRRQRNDLDTAEVFRRANS